MGQHNNSGGGGGGGGGGPLEGGFWDRHARMWEMFMHIFLFGLECGRVVSRYSFLSLYLPR
jgi:hypothetical protein